MSLIGCSKYTGAASRGGISLGAQRDPLTMVVCFPRSAKEAIEESSEAVDTPSTTSVSVADVAKASPFEFDVPVTKPTKMQEARRLHEC